MQSRLGPFFKFRNLLLGVLPFLCLQGWAQTPEDFIDELVSNDWNNITGIVFDEAGRGFVWEKRGVVHRLDRNGIRIQQPLLDLSEEVADWWDMGMTGFALDPHFQENGHFYLFYCVDRHHLFFFGTPDYNANKTIKNQATIARITRYTADRQTDFTTVVSGSRKVLVGETKETGFPMVFKTHGMGSLVFGTDGTLLASCGDSAYPDGVDTGSEGNTYWEQALADGIIKEKENVGAFRSQLIDCLNGKIIRIDPETGDGVSSNPFFDAEAPRAPRSRVFASGFRNPYRFVLKPGSGSHNPGDGQPGIFYVGDVGKSDWEEFLMVSEGGQNFGWPLFEGFTRSEAYSKSETRNLDAPNAQYDGQNCQEAHFTFNELLKPDYKQTFSVVHPCFPGEIIPDNLTMKHHRPEVVYRNRASKKDPMIFVGRHDDEGQPIVFQGDAIEIDIEGAQVDGTASIGGIFYDGQSFPEAFHDKYLHLDYSGWMKWWEIDKNGVLEAVEAFAEVGKGITSIAVNPQDGCLYYTRILDRQLRRICFGGIPAPRPVIHANRYFGSSPLEVQFWGDGSSTATDYPLSFQWDFGDGSTSNELNPRHTFYANETLPTAFTVTLTVIDSAGQSRSTQTQVSLNNTPPQVDITSIKNGGLYPVSSSTTLMLRASVSDKEHPTEELSYNWQTFLHHNDHYHPALNSMEKEEIALLSPLGCGPADYWYRIQLSVTDPAGLTSIDSILVYPYCGKAFPHWIYFIGESFTDDILLEWEIAQEEALVGFEVQRSLDQLHFEALGFIESNSTNVYTFVDHAPGEGVNTYRLKVLKNNRAFSFSENLSFTFPNQENIFIYPNPFKQNLTIHVKRVKTNTLEFRLFDALGHLVARQKMASPIESLNFYKEIRLPNLSPGVYFYQINNGRENGYGLINRY